MTLVVDVQDRDTSSAGYWVFISLHIIGLTGVLFVLTTAIAIGLQSSRRPFSRRSESWYGFMFGWLLYTFGALLLLMSGHSTDAEPPFVVCATQSVLTHSSPPYVAAATLALISQLMLNVQVVISGTHIRFEKFWKIFIVVFPYVVLLATVSLNIAITVRPGNKFHMIGYCSDNEILLWVFPPLSYD
ncbi:hypothetical protein GYMLUDRAFT_379887 [Collybiopsis luxurians FD-317 M1]|nr:hypothetical protein GYMLUDRAFT_379887 [Collybiopsis luxurians FD-317 M1]